MSWQLSVLGILALVLVAGGLWFERSRPSARLLAAVAALAALGVAGRVVLAPLPNVAATTDVALLAGYALGGPAGFAVGALSALISNFWLGQGPWTPWQMAGWGLVGLGGAALAALTARRLGRVGLALAAAVAGLLYGALLDLSAMVNFGGEQSLDRYLALSARGIPFNIAHAAGNAAIMLAAGPALVRMLERYRARFEVTWRAAPSAGAVAAAALVAIALGAAIAAGPGARSASAGRAEVVTSGAGRAVNGARAWLADSQNPNGGFGTSPGSISSPAMTGWAMLGLEAAGRNPRDLHLKGRSPVDYLRRHADELSSTGDLERTILALRGAGVSSGRLGDRDLVAELRSRESNGGSYEKQVNLTAFAVLARSAVGESDASLSDPVRWLRKAQNMDGGWGSVRRATSEPDSTGAVLQAMAAAGAERRLTRGARWLRGSQHADGGWSLTRSGDSNSQSTSWAIQGLAAAGLNPKRVHKAARTGLEYLQARQAADGHFSYSKSSDQTPVWVTAQALTALQQAPFPIPSVARRESSGGGGGSGGGAASGGGEGALGGGATSGTGGSGGSGRGSGFGAGGKGGASAAGGNEGAQGSRGLARDGGVGRAPDSLVPTTATASPILELGAETAVAADGSSSTGLLWFAVANLLAVAAVGGWIWWRRRPVG